MKDQTLIEDDRPKLFRYSLLRKTHDDKFFCTIGYYVSYELAVQDLKARFRVLDKTEFMIRKEVTGETLYEVTCLPGLA
jgi:hypothetical protein